nr:PfkB family carbohydrate kinase [Methanolobus sp.]
MSACPGGAMLNSAVSLGRTGIPVALVSELGKDLLGDMICSSLKKNNVSVEHVSRYENQKSPIALAFLDSGNNAHYSFYEDFPYVRVLNVGRSFTKKDIVMFGSILASSAALKNELTRILDSADRAGATIIYDPNIRKASTPDIEKIRSLVDNNIRHSDIVRASDEDMLSIGECRNADEAYEYVLAAGCECLIYTTAGRGVFLRTSSISKYYKTPAIRPVSTVGAGDSFTAGIVYTLYQEGLTGEKPENISSAAWDVMVSTGICFATEVCMSTENYISKEYAQSLGSKNNEHKYL